MSTKTKSARKRTRKATSKTSTQAERASKQDVEERKMFVRKHIELLEAGQTANFDELTQKFCKEFKDDSILGGRKLQYALSKDLEYYEENGIKLSVGQEVATVIRVDRSQYAIRANKQKKQKEAIASCLWNFLFGIGEASYWKNWEPFDSTQSISESEQDEVAYQINKKLSILRRAGHLSMILDSGTTTAKCCSALCETLNSIPFKTVGGQGEASNYLIPSLITNSLDAAEIVDDSSHKDQINVQMLPGSTVADRKCVSSEATLNYLNAGGVTGADLSVVGCAAIDLENHDCEGFTAESSIENQIKAKLLAMGRLKVVVSDSTKLLDSSYPHIFAPLASADLVIMDDGSETGLEKEVRNFATRSIKSGCAMMASSKFG